jgi:hypothetical protein
MNEAWTQERRGHAKPSEDGNGGDQAVSSGSLFEVGPSFTLERPRRGFHRKVDHAPVAALRRLGPDFGAAIGARPGVSLGVPG